MLYFDTSYLVRLYTQDPGWERVRVLAQTDRLACCLHGQAETLAAFHRKFREGAIQANELKTLLSEFDRDSVAGAFRWLPLSASVIGRMASTYATLPATVALRAADAMHLACAADAGITKVFSNDARLLAAASYFGVVGEDIL